MIGKSAGSEKDGGGGAECGNELSGTKDAGEIEAAHLERVSL